MALDRGLTHAVGDALVALLDVVWPRVGLRVDELLEKVGDAVRPDPPMTVRTLDGLVLTGLLVCDGAGQVLAFIGTRSPASNGFSPPRPDPRERRYPDASIPMWSRDLDPRDLEVDPYRHR